MSPSSLLFLIKTKSTTQYVLRNHANPAALCRIFKRKNRMTRHFTFTGMDSSTFRLISGNLDVVDFKASTIGTAWG